MNTLRSMIPPSLYAYFRVFAPPGIWIPPVIAAGLVLFALPLLLFAAVFPDVFGGPAAAALFFAVVILLFWISSGAARSLVSALSLYWRVGRKIPVEHSATFAQLLGMWDEVCKRVGWADRREITEVKDGKEVRRVEWVAPQVIGVDANGPDLIVTALLPVGTTPSTFQSASEAWRAAMGVHAVRISDTSTARGPAVVLCFSMRDRLAGTVKKTETYSARPLGAVEVANLEDGSRLAWDVRDASHTIVQGQTRSGKSVGCYTMLSEVARMNDDDVQVWGIDPARLLLSPWGNRVNGRDRIVLGTDPAEVSALMKRLIAEMEARLLLLDERGIEKFEPGTEGTPPLMLVVLEEWAALMQALSDADSLVKPAERVKGRIAAGMQRLVSEGAKVGVRVLLIVQRADAETVGGYARGQFGTRITFAVEDAQSVGMLHPSLDADRLPEVLSFPPGRALTWVHRVQRVGQFDLTDYGTYRRLVLNGGEEPLSPIDDDPIQIP